MKTHAMVTEGKGAFALEWIEIDPPGRREVLIEIKASGVCHTDWDSLFWGRRLILGHEGAGRVVATGAGVDGIAIGDRVMLNWAIPCSSCFQCRRGKENLCEQRGTVPDERFRFGGGPLNASFNLGTMATHAMVPEAAVLPLHPEVPYEVAAIMGCAVMTGFGSAVNAAQVVAGSTVVVIGCGGVGLSAILGARYCGAARIIALDINPERLECALLFGASETLLADCNDKGLLHAAREVRSRTSGHGADYAFECTAVPELGPAPLAMVRNGGTCIGVSGIEQVVPFDLELFEWDKLYSNSLYGGCQPQRDFPLLTQLYLKKLLPLDAMVTRRYRLEDLDQAFRDMHAGRNAKGVLVFD
jgi:S-(hydroxymethyl)glutathione dehydrogenase/alcohol dehydrogenase